MAQTGCHKTVETILNKYLLMLTFEYGKNYSIRFGIMSNNGPLFDSVLFEMNKKTLLAQHYTCI